MTIVIVDAPHHLTTVIPVTDIGGHALVTFDSIPDSGVKTPRIRPIDKFRVLCYDDVQIVHRYITSAKDDYHFLSSREE